MITTCPSSDEQLLKRYIEQQDEDAFAGLVARHESLVRATCQRMLGQGGDAEDATQATFLILARHAQRLEEKAEANSGIASWLYRVAVNESLLQLRSGRARRAREQRVVQQRPAPADQTTDAVIARELQIIIEKELVGLPPELRAPIILYHLEGKNQHAAAEELGLTYATFRRRLEQGRKLLRARLQGRGVVVSIAFLAFSWRSSLGHAAVGDCAPLGLSKLLAEAKGAGTLPATGKSCLVAPRVRKNPSTGGSTTTWSCAKSVPLVATGRTIVVASIVIGALFALSLPPAVSFVAATDAIEEPVVTSPRSDALLPDAAHVSPGAIAAVSD